MSRARLIWEAQRMLRDMAPELAAGAAEAIIGSGPMQRWFDSIERRRPRGLVALFRRLRGKDRGLTPEQRDQLEEFLRAKLSERRGGAQ